MGFIPRSQNKIIEPFILISLVFLATGYLWILPGTGTAAITDYDPEIDISVGLLNYMYTPLDLKSPTANLPELGMGLYAGGYLGLKSPLFTFFFNSQNIRTTYEAGVAFNQIGAGNYFISIPLIVDLSYRISLFKKKKFALQPFVGSGFDVVRSSENNDSFWQVHYLVNAGLEIKYFAWDNTSLKIKASYGIIFVDDLESGFMHFIKVRFPVPFIP
jgi:hypothetical protein